MQVGFGCVDVTPPIGAIIPGYMHQRHAKGVHDPLLVTAVTFANDEVTLALVSVDALSIKSSTVAQARERAQELCGIPASNILIATTHTHNGGPTANAFLCDADEAYCDWLAKQIASAVAIAYEKRVDADIGMGVGYEDTIAFNRRCVLKDGTQRTHPGKLNPNITRIAGPIDPWVGVLGVRSVGGKFLGCIINYTCHATVIGGVYFSADYIHYVRETIRAMMGHDSHVVYLNGACGDVTQISQLIPRANEVGEEWAWRIGGRIGAEAVKVLLSMDYDRYVNERIPLAVRSRRLSIPVRKVPPETLAEAKHLLEQEGEWTTDRIYARELVLLNEMNEREPEVPAEIMTMLIGDVAIASFPCEYFCQFGLEIKRASPHPYTFVVSGANGMVGYVPTEEALRTGGYEPRLARSSKLVPEAGVMMRDTAIELLHQLPKPALKVAAEIPHQQAWDAGASSPKKTGI